MSRFSEEFSFVQFVHFILVKKERSIFNLGKRSLSACSGRGCVRRPYVREQHPPAPPCPTLLPHQEHQLQEPPGASPVAAGPQKNRNKPSRWCPQDLTWSQEGQTLGCLLAVLPTQSKGGLGPHQPKAAVLRQHVLCAFLQTI